MSIVPVALMSNKQRETIETAAETPTLVEIEQGSTNTICLDSRDRSAGNLSTFWINLKYQLVKVRYIQLKRVVLPKIPNINPLNNTIVMRSQFGGGTVTSPFTLPVGLYNTTTFSNVLVSAINTAFVAAGIVDTVTCTWSPTTRTFSLSSVNGIALAFDSTCSFITGGVNMAPFESQLMSVAATKTTLYTSTCGMIYTKYITVSSDALTQYSIGNSILSTPSQPPSVIAVVDLVDLYEASDFDITKVFSGVYKAVDVNTAPHLRVANSSRSLPQTIDLEVRDEFGNELNSVVQLGSPYPTDNSSIALLLEVSF